MILFHPYDATKSRKHNEIPLASAFSMYDLPKSRGILTSPVPVAIQGRVQYQSTTMFFLVQPGKLCCQQGTVVTIRFQIRSAKQSCQPQGSYVNSLVFVRNTKRWCSPRHLLRSKISSWNLCSKSCTAAVTSPLVREKE